ncbi:MAG TPA: hypothetical protein VM554_11470 [Acidisarcina sp.]|nr:hypothetical protein [Acidisarcina sp.]
MKRKAACCKGSVSMRAKSFGAILGVLLAAILFSCGGFAFAQDTAATAKQNEQKARAVLDAMVQALGGDRWLSMQNRVYEGRRSGFYKGDPTGAIVDYFEFHQFPDQDRVEFTKKRDVVQILTGREGWEITYRGKKALPKDQVDAALRHRDHSIEVAVKVWMKDPRTMLFYEGQRTVQRHLADQVTILSGTNDSITIQMDAQDHLPVRSSFEWRDPVYKDKNESAEEYDDYHVVEGIPTPFTITSYQNGEMTGQHFLYRASYNVTLPPETFDPDRTASKIKK